MLILKIKKTLRKKKEDNNYLSLSVALLLITLIAGLFWVKKNKESSHENNDIRNVNDNDNVNVNDNDNEKPNSEEVIVNEDEYFFNRKSGQVTINILLFLGVGILFFFWENDKLPSISSCYCSLKGFSSAIIGENFEEIGFSYRVIGLGLFEKSNWFGFATLGALITITFLVEFVLNLLIGSISHLFSKDKNKRYFHTSEMSFRKRFQYFSSFSIAKTLFIALSYLLCGFIIAIFARVARRCEFWHSDTGRIIDGHNNHYCCGYCEVSGEVNTIDENNKNNKQDN